MIEGEDGAQVEVYTADELAAARTEGASAKETELKPKMTELETELTGAKTALAARAGEFAQFRKLSEEQVAAMTEKDRIIYENSLALNKANEDRVAAEESAAKERIINVIKAKAGANEALKTKMEEMWPLIAVEAVTPEQIEAKAQMVLGAISTQTPNLVAGVAGFNGSYSPPGDTGTSDKTFGETEAGKGLAERLGIQLEPKK